jgi:hypothetical protein
MWIANPWQDNLLRHFLRTGDYWVATKTRDGWAEYGPAMLIVGGHWEDQRKLYAIKDILGGEVRRTLDWYRGSSSSEWEYLWLANELTERYLRWLEDKWENHNVLDAHNRRRRVQEALEAFDESNPNR